MTATPYLRAVSPPQSTLASSGLTPAIPLEAPHPMDCDSCSWVMTRPGTWALKFISGRCLRHGLQSGFSIIPWSRHNGYWGYGRQS